MAAAIGTHGTVGVAGLCQCSLPSTALEEVSSRSPLERNKRGMLYTLMTFPQWPSKNNSSPLNCRALAGTGGESPLLNRGREILSALSVHCARPANRGWDNQISMWHGAYSGQPRYCPRSPPPRPGLIVPPDPTHGHVETPPQPKLVSVHPLPPADSSQPVKVQLKANI